nr:MAG TPA: hypothetical protein [Bacteriophage sp.]DAW45119.1 MAG TPA: hypothetical protein [Bacteriophage sp.]
MCCRLENPENLLKYKEELGEFGVEKKMIMLILISR